MMFDQLVQSFRDAIERNGFCSADLYASGFATSVVVKYLPNDEMEIGGLLEFPPYLLFNGEVIYLDPEKKNPVNDKIDKVDLGFYQSFRSWDPRVIVGALVDEEPPPLGGRGKLRYNAKQAIPLFHEVEDFYMALSRKVRDIEEVEFIADGVRLSELTLYELFSSSPEIYTIRFQYQGQETETNGG